MVYITKRVKNSDKQIAIEKVMKMKKAIVVLGIIAMGALSSCSPMVQSSSTIAPLSTSQTESVNETRKAEYRKISAEQAQEMMQGEEPFILLDVRTEQEFLEQRIEGAVLIPDVELSSRAEKELPDKDAVILVYCRSGRRSAASAQQLVDMGYTNVYDFGGIIDWPYETVQG